jgi:hypothetical protein
MITHYFDLLRVERSRIIERSSCCIIKIQKRNDVIYMIAKSKQTIIRERDELIDARKNAITIELNACYSHLSHSIKIESINNSTFDFCVLITSYIDNFKYVDVLIVKYNVENRILRSFATFDVVHEMNDSKNN